jgi:hypothetical protein
MQEVVGSSLALETSYLMGILMVFFSSSTHVTKWYLKEGD